jgi:hypothetical protein
MTGHLDVVGIALLIAALVIGVWMGLSGPDVSPIFTEFPLTGGGSGGGR